MALRIVVQKQVGKQWYNTDLAYDFDKLIEILRARMHENLSLNEKELKDFLGRVKGIKREWTMPEIESALEAAAKFLIEEFKLKTVSIV